MPCYVESMGDVTNELLLENLKALRKEVSEIKLLRHEVRDGFVSVRQYLSAIQSDYQLLERRISTLEDDLDGPPPDFGQPPAQFRPGVAAVGEDMAEPRKSVADGGQYVHSAVPVLNVGFMHLDPDHQAGRVGDDMALVALDFLPGIIAARPAAFCGFDALGVDHPGAGRGLPSVQFPRCHDEHMVDRVQQAAVPPVVKVTLYGRGRRKVLRKHCPLAPRRRHVQNRVHNLAQSRFTGTPAALLRRHEGREQRPFRIRHIACVTSAATGIIGAGGFSPDHCDLQCLLQSKLNHK
jgi:hypothetical protein